MQFQIFSHLFGDMFSQLLLLRTTLHTYYNHYELLPGKYHDASNLLPPLSVLSLYHSQHHQGLSYWINIKILFLIIISWLQQHLVFPFKFYKVHPSLWKFLGVPLFSTSKTSHVIHNQPWKKLDQNCFVLHILLYLSLFHFYQHCQYFSSLLDALWQCLDQHFELFGQYEL